MSLQSALLRKCRRLGARARRAAVLTYRATIPLALRHTGLLVLRHTGHGVASHERFLAGQRAIILNSLQIKTVLDVGANVGQYAQELRRLGFEGDIHSFEPGAQAWSALARSANRDPRWYVHRCALSDHIGEDPLYDWSGSVWASLRRPGDHLRDRMGEPADEVVAVTTLKAWLDSHPVLPSRSLLKIDVQGSEREVLVGAGDRLSQFSAVEIEAPLRSSYPGEALLPELLTILDEQGFVCASVMTERFHDSELGADDVDVLAVSRRLVPRLPVPPE